MSESDVIVIGAGHAGCEAALACARMGLKTTVFAINLDSVAMMPCNPNIGGSSKGHIVREIDALGGEMGKNIDKTYIQSRMLNTGKGPAVYSLRAQADKRKYSAAMKRVLENEPNIILKQHEVVKILVEEDGQGRTVAGVVTDSGAVHTGRAVILCGGTYLRSRCLYGETIIQSGPNGFKNAATLSENLKELGIRLFRFKTGTPARLDKKTIDFSKMEEQKGDERIVPFSFENTAEEIARPQISCYLTYTNEKTHAVIRENLHRAPMYSGVIEGTGTRYCPSIEDKVVRFADKDRHQVFIEPEGEDTNEMYVSGMSTSLPEDVQIAMYRTVPGLENSEIMRNGYAIEYDCIDATQLKLSLEFKEIHGLFSAGQVNGSSGYEEAAGQGLMAGINAARLLQGEEPLILDRSDAYIGVLIDDLVTKGTKEPYRMMTSRAEYRLLLRQDNADLRLTPKGYAVGLIHETRYQNFLRKKERIAAEVKRVGKVTVTPSAEHNELLTNLGAASLMTGAKLADLIRRPELSYEKLAGMDLGRPSDLTPAETEEINIQIKYDGYIKRQLLQVEQFKRLEGKILPEDMDYDEVRGLRLEARQKLKSIRPRNIGHASRITGVSPADIAMLIAHIGK